MTRRWLMAALLAATVLASPSGAQAIPSPPDPVRWWDTGDSYASGEGTTGAQGYCQQSDRAFGPKAAQILRQQRSWSIPNPVFSACTGHTAMDQRLSKAEQRFVAAQPTCAAPGSVIEERPPGNVPADDQSLRGWAQAQSGWPADGRFDVITASFGGNDLCFADLIVGCLGVVPDLLPEDGWLTTVKKLPAGGGCDVSEADLERRIDALFDGGIPYLAIGEPAPASLPEVWRDLVDNHLRPDGVLTVVGYPRLVTPSSDWGAWRNGRCNTISAQDADMLGRASEKLDARMAQAVAEADAGQGRIQYVSRLALFDDGGRFHSLCSRGVEWLNTALVFLRDGSTGFRKERGFHPNDLGHVATAEAVAGVVEQVAVAQAAPPTTRPAPPSNQAAPSETAPPPTQPRVESGEMTFEVGSDFRARCTIAWPTAPQRGVDSIQMRTTCSNQPAQFLFVDIVYPDPDLAVTPSRSTMDVSGFVADIVRSEFGFTVLVVYAESITLQ